MKILRTVEELNKLTNLENYKSSSIGFVPTMGALHQGHSSLITKSKSENQIVICSIFVNPTQFNKPEDLENYPRTEEKDITILEDLGCDYLFMPSNDEIYDNYIFPEIDLKQLELVMEGKFRPGHFKGVCQVVYRLFDLIKPTKAYFGLKDFQQVAVIKFMTKHFLFPIEIIACQTIREENGLAMSSRNLRLSEAEKKDSLIIFNTLQFIKENLENFDSIKTLKDKAINYFHKGNLTLEYLEIVDQNTLTQSNEKVKKNLVVCIAAYCNKIRLIDNMILS
jgi:pantoate--beta-alanine ligase